MKNRNSKIENKLKKIIFVHEGKAIYPDIQAYKKYFKSRYEIEEVLYNELDNKTDYSDCILWYMMGFYPKKIKAGFIIHDYRSLSTGCFAWLKDKLKKYLNHKPNLRIFLNDYVKNTMSFRDSIDSIFLDMGVPESILKYRDESEQKYKYDFCYIGSISLEREINKLLKNFLNTYKDTKTFVLAGRVEDKDFFKEFTNSNNIIYKGLVSQNEAFKVVQDSEFAVCYLPKTKPFCYQTPTKLLEYIVLSKKIIINDCPSNLKLVQKFNVPHILIRNSNFPNKKELDEIKNDTDRDFNYKELLWDEVIKNSEIDKYIK